MVKQQFLLKVVVTTLVYILLFAAVPVNAQTKAPPVQKYKGFAVVELFTSQGCSSCPPADKALSELIADAKKNNKPVYGISFHVDYWNKHGWKDPYSKMAFTKRQNNYVSAVGNKEVYTPQVFVNGKTAFVGSDKKRLLAETDKELKIDAEVDISVQSKGVTNDTLLLYFTSSKVDRNYSLVMAMVQPSITTKVAKGENTGKTLVHDNVVRAFEIYPLNSPSGTVKFPMRKIAVDKSFSMIVYVQQKQSKHILGATAFDF